jgi:UDP-hydrolysing UDP-N-acetyl-D-glucosamine 2-epimerase
MKNRKICVVTGSRADYGLLFWLLREIESAADLDLQLVVTGSHLEQRFGRTLKIIEADGFPIAGTVDTLLTGDDPVAVTKSMGTCTSGMADVFNRLSPDILVALGDRVEMLAAATAAMVARIPIAHIHGGEATEGLIDEAVRHSLTKMSHLHFVAAEPYRNRVIQMGEQPDRVFNVGAPGLDNIKNLELLDRKNLSEALCFNLEGPLFLATYHPVTLSNTPPRETVDAFLAALDAFPEARIIVTGVNADPGNNTIDMAINEFAAARPDKVMASTNLGQTNYLSAVMAADVVIGNSSSGIFEAPALRTPTVNIGARQRGRLKASSVIDCEDDRESIVKAITKAISPEFSTVAEITKSLFGEGESSTKICRLLRGASLDNILMKRFFDIPMTQNVTES